MAILYSHLRIPRDGESESVRKGGLLGEVINRKYVKEFEVYTSDPLDGPETILTWPLNNLIPKIGDSYVAGNDADLLATCVRVHCATYSDDPLHWLVTAYYDTSRLVTAATDNPLNQPAEISWGGSQFSRPLMFDAQGVPVVTSAGNRFDPPLEKEDSRPTLTIQRNEATFSAATAQLYRDAVNADIFATAPPGFAKITSITADRQVDFGLVYWRTKYEIQFKDDSFYYFVLDQDYRAGANGSNYAVGPPPSGIAPNGLFRDVLDNTPLSNPTLLGGTGQALSLGTTTLGANVALNDTQITVTLTSARTVYFPPFVLGASAQLPPDWYFQIKVDNEVMTVVASADQTSGAMKWNVVRAIGGSLAATHTSGAAVTLQPYFRRFLPHKILPFAPLALPAVT